MYLMPVAVAVAALIWFTGPQRTLDALAEHGESELVDRQSVAESVDDYLDGVLAESPAGLDATHLAALDAYVSVISERLVARLLAKESLMAIANSCEYIAWQGPGLVTCSGNDDQGNKATMTIEGAWARWRVTRISPE